MAQKSNIIKVEGLSKKYLLNKTLSAKSDTLFGTFLNGMKNLKSLTQKRETEEFWALQDVSFEINQGDRVGIIGRNGAGKSTLLKILSRITPPTSGRIELGGRVASLLEVGTGFHGDLSGRENIYLNGSILGMSKAEINKKFDEIIAFAEIDKFLDTPVKRYSSGMYVRLAFAVAAHLEPDILIVDEVLAVGDAAFQEKCLGKMKDVSGQGRTVLFVSHNMGSIQSLCDKAIVMNKGKLMFDGNVAEGMSYYLVNNNYQSGSLADRTDRQGNGKFKFTSLDFENSKGLFSDEIMTGEALNLKIGFENKGDLDLSKLLISVTFMDEFQNLSLAFVSDEMGADFSFLKGKQTLTLHIPELLLRGNAYSIRLFASHHGTSEESICDNIENAAKLNVISSDLWNSGQTLRKGNYAVIKGTYCS